MKKDIENYKNGKGKLNKVLNNFFEEIIYECKGARGKYSPIEVLESDEMINWVLEYIKTKPNFYTGNEVTNVKSFLRQGAKYTQKVANFCPRTARDIMFRYFDINGDKINILDTSSGFGSRMSAALLSGHNYTGIDPNVHLYSKLLEYKEFLTVNKLILESQECNLICNGSENFINELENKFDIMFTSPPYYTLETYGEDDGQSTVKFKDYNDWIEGFVKPTISNIHKYLKNDGYAMINIKNLTRGGKQKLFDDWFDILNSVEGFEFVEVFKINHQAKNNFWKNANYSAEKYQGFKEPVMVFKKIA